MSEQRSKFNWMAGVSLLFVAVALSGFVMMLASGAESVAVASWVSLGFTVLAAVYAFRMMLHADVTNNGTIFCAIVAMGLMVIGMTGGLQNTEALENADREFYLFEFGHLAAILAAILSGIVPAWAAAPEAGPAYTAPGPEYSMPSPEPVYVAPVSGTVCKVCGAENPTHARFCLGCGCAMTVRQPEPVQYRQPEVELVMPSEPLPESATAPVPAPEQGRICPHCQGENSGRAKFCRHCGSSLHPGEPVPCDPGAPADPAVDRAAYATMPAAVPGVVRNAVCPCCGAPQVEADSCMYCGTPMR